MQKLKVIIILFIISSSLTYSDNKSVVTQSANKVIDVLEGRSFERHITPLMIDIARNGHSLSEETKIKLKSLGFDFSGSIVTMARSAYYDYYYETDNFRIHYDLTGNNAVDNTITNENNIPDYINTMANIFEEVYNHDINELGYIPPPSDGMAGGSPAFDIEVKSTNAYGWTNYGAFIGDNPNSPNVTENNAYLSSMILRNNYVGFPNTELENIQVTAAHEFFHAIQLGYDGEEEVWLMEATAVWMEEEHYDNVNDCYQYMIPWFEKPHIPLNSMSGLHRYGSFILFKYIDEHLGGQEMIKRTWEQSRIFDSTQDDYSIHSIDLALKSNNHTFKKALNNMAIANVIFSPEDAAGQYAYEETIGYQNYREFAGFNNDSLAIVLTILDSLDFIKGIPVNIESDNLQKYASQYIKINATDPVKVSINSQDLILHTIVKSNSGNYEVQSGYVINIDPGSNAEWIYAVVVASDDEIDNSYNISFTDGIKNNYTDFTILGQFPNPFNNSITVKLKVITPQNIDLEVYDMLGRKITTIFSGYLPNGNHEYLWNGANANNEKVSSGVYYITAMSDNRQEWKKITLIK